jgi:hypothetical protein
MIKREIYLTFILIVFLAGCQRTSPTPSLSLTPAQSPPTRPSATSAPTQMAPATAESLQPTITPAPFTAAPSSAAAQPLSPFTIDWKKPFAGEVFMVGSIALTNWTPQAGAGNGIPLPFSLSQVENAQVLDGLTDDQKAFLTENGFVLIHSQEAQFGDIRVETAERTGQPYYLTTDAAYHALHLLFDDLLKSLEREYFRSQMIAITKATLSQVSLDLPETQGTSIEADAREAQAYLSVALKLFDPAAEIDPALADLVSQQVDQIMAASGRANSVVFPDFEDDYGAYKPTGHYAGDPDLEVYFRGMTWLGRVHFLLQDPANPNFIPSRLPLIVTLALRRAQVNGQPASDAWAELHSTLTFVIGPSDDAGPLEFSQLMDQVYGNSPKVQDLADQALWQEFLSRSEQLPAPQINSLFVDSTKDLSTEKGWRFMGQRFTLDSMIFQNVIFDRVEAKPDNTRRELPSGLDVMAAFGSSLALQELEKQGVSGFPNYNGQMEKMQAAVRSQPEEQWIGRFYDGWLYSFFPLVRSKDSAYPATLQTPAWNYKDLNTALGSWAELKHDTILYTKMPEMAGGGGPPMSGPAPSYVEPDPPTFYRLAYIARTLSCGLQNHVLHDFCDTSAGSTYTDLPGYILGMGRLGETFETLGNIAAKELANQPLDEDEKSAITNCLGMIECLNADTGYSQPNSELPEVPVIAAVSGAQDQVLEVGVGNVDRIYVAVPLENKWEIAQGGVFSYYEFPQPRNKRLTDEEWRANLSSGEVELPVWASNFILPGGQPNEMLYFRVGDIYIITKAGDKLNVREAPSTGATVVTQLKTGDYVEIVAGPQQANGYTWWQIKLFDLGSDVETMGWAVENQEWYVRSYLPDQPQE